jgi:hypothetical protein
MDAWVMLGIVLFVLIGQAALWSWVFIQWRRKAPDVRPPDPREFLDAARTGVAAAQRRLQERRRR